MAELAGRQHGVVARRQLLALGFSVGAIAHRLRSGRLRRLSPGVYAVGHDAISRRGRWLAAVLASGSEAVLSHRSGAALWGIRSAGSHAIEVAVPRTSCQRAAAIRRHYLRLRPDEWTVLDAIPVTTASRTIFDLAASAGPDVAEAALRQAEYLRLAHPVSLPVLLDRYPRHRGVRAIRSALAHCEADPDGRTRSPLEDSFFPFLDHHRLPRPRLNFQVHLGEKRCEVDCLWPAPRLIVELDGFAAHGTRRAFRDDRERDRRLIAAGYRVVRISRDQLEAEPAAIAADLRATLGHPA
jgi:very-short-patch-repair endonuclease